MMHAVRQLKIHQKFSIKNQKNKLENRKTKLASTTKRNKKQKYTYHQTIYLFLFVAHTFIDLPTYLPTYLYIYIRITTCQIVMIRRKKNPKMWKKKK